MKKRTAKRQVQETIRTFYRFARAAQNNELLFDDQFPNTKIASLTDKNGNPSPALSDWISRVMAVIDRIELPEEEEDLLDEMAGKVTEPIEKYIKPRTERKEDLPKFNSEEEAEASGLPSGTIVLINGRKARLD